MFQWAKQAFIDTVDSSMARPLLVEVLSDKRTDLRGIYCVWYCVSHKKRNSSQIATQQRLVVKS